MKVIIEIDENCIEEQVTIKCSEINEKILKLQKTLNNSIDENLKLELSKDKKDFYINVDDLLFFETDGDFVCAHTADDVFVTKYRLYELEKILPWYFSRISKSSILNVNKVYSVTKNLTASSIIGFKGSKKQVYVSRIYYKPLMSKIDEIRKN